MRLWQRLTDFSLNAYKDMVFDFDEPLTPYDPQGEKCSYDDYWIRARTAGTFAAISTCLIQRYWDVSGSSATAAGEYFKLYANSRAGWTEAQRQRIRSILIFIAHFAAEDSF